MDAEQGIVGLIVLGLIAFGENPGACLLRDGRLVAFAEEERFTRLKGSAGMFPGGATTFCLASEGLGLDDVDCIAFGWDPSRYPWRMARRFSSTYIRNLARERRAFHRSEDRSSYVTALENLFYYHPARIRAKIEEGLRRAGIGGEIPAIRFVPHHLAHAYSAYFCSRFERAGILTIDGSGEDVCTQLAVGDGESLQVVEQIPIPNSLGWFYAAITEYLGFLPYRDEGKLMGLAAIGEPRRSRNAWIPVLSRMLDVRQGAYEVDPIYTYFGSHSYGNHHTDEFVSLITREDSEATPIRYGEKVRSGDAMISRYLLDRYVDLAWAAQELLEQAAVSVASRLVREYNVENLCIAGGVGMNCKMNGEILRRSGCRNIFVQPASNDSGTALGAAMVVAQEMGDFIHNPLLDAYAGPEFEEGEVFDVLRNCKLDFRETADPAQCAADLLADGNIVAWFQNRMEFGARALGNRSILADPAMPSVKTKVNEEVKYRESWRPFCPSMTEEAAKDYIRDANDASFMIVAYEATDRMRRELESVVHVDNTIRPQVVSKESNPPFHRLIETLGTHTGHEVVLNTSLNVRGEPIVRSPLEAVRAFFSTGLDSLIIGNFVLEKSRAR